MNDSSTPSLIASRLRAHPRVLVLTAILVASFALRMAFLHEPFERDEGIYAAVGQEILRGGLPYRDAIDIKPPAVYYTYALAIAALGPTVPAIRVFTAVYACFTLLLVYLISLRLFGVRAALLSAAVYGVFGTTPLMQASSSNTEVFMMLPVLAAFAAALRYADNGKARDLLLAGAASGLALLVKTVALPHVLVPLGLVVVARPRTPPGHGATRRLLLFALPGAALVAATCAFFALRGAWAEFYYWNVSFIVGKYRNLANSAIPLADTLSLIAPELVVPAVLGASGIVRVLRARTPERMAAALLLPAAVVGVFLPGKNYPHYFIQLLPALAILSGFALDALPSVRWRLRTAAASVTGCGLAWFIWNDAPIYVSWSPEQVSTHKYGAIFADAAVVSTFVRARTKPDEYVFQWGFEPEIYFLADRRSPVPYLASVFVGADRDPERATEALVAGLLARPPKYIVASLSLETFRGDEEIAALLRSRYAFEGRYANFEVYRLVR